MTVRALNKVAYGGPMALSVCHSKAYGVDTTPPIVNDFNNIRYDDKTGILSAIYNAT